MVRAPMGDEKYWEARVANRHRAIDMATEQIRTPSQNPAYRPQYLFDLAHDYPRLILTQYSRGDGIQKIDNSFEELLAMWELSNKLAEEICLQKNQKECRDWKFELSNLNHYNWCFWLVGLALVLEIPNDQWKRLLHLIDGDGEDELLDRIIASRQSDRVIGTRLLHKKPYARLLKAIDAPKPQQAVLLRDFVDHWYTELDRKGPDELWWYVYGDPVKHPLKMGSYFGRWCIEAVAAVKVFNLDDSLCLGQEHYPGDLLRPDGATTHISSLPEKRSLLNRLLRR